MQKGYTLPELLVVVAIIALMTGLLLPIWRSGDKTLSLQRTVHKAGQDVRRAQELSLRAQTYTCQTGSIFAYGIYFDIATPTSYLIFAECDSSSIGYNPGNDGIVETVQIDNDARMIAVGPANQMSIVFEPPVPTVFIEPGSPGAARVSFQRKDGQGVVRVLNVSSKGVIDID